MIAKSNSASYREAQSFKTRMLYKPGYQRKQNQNPKQTKKDDKFLPLTKQNGIFPSYQQIRWLKDAKIKDVTQHRRKDTDHNFFCAYLVYLLWPCQHNLDSIAR